MIIDNLISHPNAPHAVEALEALGTLDDAFLQKAHLAVLEERGYVDIRKEFVRRKPHTTYSPTGAGRAAFRRYLQVLERIIRAADTAVRPQDATPEAELAARDQRRSDTARGAADGTLNTEAGA